MDDKPTTPMDNRQTAGALAVARSVPDGKGLAVLAQWVIDREKSVAAEMADWRTWRQRCEWYWDNDLEFRKNEADPEHIFNVRNTTLGTVRSGITFKVAKAQQDIFGSVPWMSVTPEGNLDLDLAEKVGNHAQWKLRLAGAKVFGDEVIERAFWFGEAICRLNWCRRVEKYEEIIRAVVSPDGQPYSDPAGNHITDQTRTETIKDESGEDITTFPDAPDVEYPRVGGNQWEKFIVPREVTVYDGLDFGQVDWRSWRCPIGAVSLDDVDFHGHEYQLSRGRVYEKLCSYYGDKKEEWPEEILALYLATATEPTGQKTQEGQAKNSDRGDENNPYLRLIDAVIYWTPSPEVQPNKYFVTVLPDYPDVPLFVDYLANVVPINGTRHRSPYYVVAVNRKPGSWAGRSDWEAFSGLNEEVDQMWNENQWRNSMIANPMSIVDETVIKDRIENVKFGPGRRVKRQAGKEGMKFIEWVVAPDTQSGQREDLNYLLMTNQLETGVTSAARGGIGDMPATNTATGIQSVLSSGSVLHAKPIGDCKEGFEMLFTGAISLLYAHHDKAETFTYGEGENQVVASLGPEDVRGITMNVTLTMTRASQTERLQNATVGTEAFMKYITLPPQNQAQGRPLFIQALQAAQIKNADKIIAEPSEESMQPPEPNPLEHIKVTFADLPPSYKASVLATLGIEGDPSELEDDDAEDDGREKEDENEKEPGPESSSADMKEDAAEGEGADS